MGNYLKGILIYSKYKCMMNLKTPIQTNKEHIMNLNDIYRTYPCRDCSRYVHPPYCPVCGGNVGKYPTLKEAMERLKAISERSEK